jgi:thioredoxin-related protein
MDTVSYPDGNVADFIHKYLIPLRVHTNAAPEWARRFSIQYTPTMLVLDDDGKEHHRSVGFLPPEEFIATLMLGIAKLHKDQGSVERARAMVNWLLTAYPGSKAAASANELRATLN